MEGDGDVPAAGEGELDTSGRAHDEGPRGLVPVEGPDEPWAGDRGEPPLLFGVVAPGFLYSAVFGKVDGHAWGAELSWTWFPERRPPAEGWGVWLQAQSHPAETSSDGGEHALRTAAGLQYAWTLLGAEVGWSYRAESARFRGTHGLHLAPYASIGLLVVAPRLTLSPAGLEAAASGGQRRGWGHEFALSLAFKVPLPAPEYPDYITLHHGRPLRAAYGDAARLPAVGCGPAPGGRGGAVPGGTPATARHGRAVATGTPATARHGRAVARWLRVAAEERAAVSAFARLTEELADLGAPPALVARAVTAAVDERRHAAAALALARRASTAVDGAPSARRSAARSAEDAVPPATTRGRERAHVPVVTLGALAVFPPRAPDLAALAREALLDGCLGEGLAAEVARRRALRARTAGERAFYRTIAAEEHAHAELGWDILRWAVHSASARERGGDGERALDAAELAALVATVRPPARQRAAASVVVRRARARLRRWARTTQARAAA